MDIFSVIIYFYNEIRKSFLLLFQVESCFVNGSLLRVFIFIILIYKYFQTDILSHVTI